MFGSVLFCCWYFVCVGGVNCRRSSSQDVETLSTPILLWACIRTCFLTRIKISLLTPTPIWKSLNILREQAETLINTSVFSSLSVLYAWGTCVVIAVLYLVMFIVKFYHVYLQGYNQESMNCINTTLWSRSRYLSMSDNTKIFRGYSSITVVL